MEHHRHDAGQRPDANERDEKKAVREELEAGGGAGEERVVNRGHGVATVNRGVVAIQHVTFNTITAVACSRRIVEFLTRADLPIIVPDADDRKRRIRSASGARIIPLRERSGSVA
jgi:hypothetical protein